ncbi:fibronectin type III-like domain-contianing protein [Halosquirtibacter laminarini]|uniref:Fibronectin type III-like domain-contianing protein n=1 Tax=Halosquirtibacter laminarini TaxID=3374600 RepID=A0AC61NHS5_9BACT|nr:fibronectin type III-like domain-contianing protein [Prolixibacteraceae bacterium]
MVPQIYVHHKNSKIDQPVRSLVGFKKIFLQPRESKNISITIPKEKLYNWNTNRHQWVLDKGNFVFQLAEHAGKVIAKESIYIE